MKTTTRSTVCFVLILTLFICSCNIPSFGPRLSHAVALGESAMVNITETDIPSLLPVSETTSTTQIKTILSVISLAFSNIETVTFRMRVFPL